MAIGDLWEVTTGDCSDLYYLDTGMYDTEGYGAVYILDTDKPAIIDSGIGTNYERILDALDELDIAREDLQSIVLTHVHLDHAGGAGFIADECPNADVFIHEIGARHLVNPEYLVKGTKSAVGDQWEFYVEPKPVPEDRIVELTDGDVIECGHELEATHAPGHAPHQLIFYDRENDAVFTGDAAGIWVPKIERIRETSPPSDFDLDTCLDDVETIREIAPTTLLYPHFGPRPYSDEAMDEYGEVLSQWVAAVESRRAAADDDEAVIEHFVEEQEMNDVWGKRKAEAETVLNTRGVLHYLDQRDDD
ncbi:Glyoxylase, beta-lactamase superfamily II [Haladaptatus litoreus]|uniref:Glyoxylase, beta-lactamase superfamily II n=1 Tax=Haladaptatus litoreus TaxID=553468 RepID=A0A1N7BCD5_9EURY|nr:MBL fold metallo-hydrolase [Haladaptatus litoreus]SIR48987.1 Glyoxylase, beta-lactamase superfamily II [Haladaptatus litoreus]